MNVRIIDAIEGIDAAAWNELAGTDYPFTRHEFLVALERHDCVGPEYGWLPRHVTVWDNARLVGAAPMYLKYNSYGELVFDWSWASAYERHGLPYYPKLVSAIPYTPATGGRMLVADGEDEQEIRRHIADAAREHAEEQGLSSLHWLFTQDGETDFLETQGLMRRTGCQFHWQNRGYSSFDDFLGALAARKRKNIRRERQRVLESSTEIGIRLGGELSDAEWRTWHRLYVSTFERKSGVATLSEGFFREIGRTLPERVIVVFARRHGDTVAGALCLRGADTLYGRHWGAFEHHDGLHFETCYYQGLEFCIRQGMARFEPGAQGEHKVARGFLPRPTWSAHWIADPGFRAAIGRFLVDEQQAMADYLQEMSARSPYRSTG